MRVCDFLALTSPLDWGFKSHPSTRAEPVCNSLEAKVGVGRDSDGVGLGVGVGVVHPNTKKVLR